MTLISLARFISLFPKPMDENENNDDKSEALVDIKKS